MLRYPVQVRFRDLDAYNHVNNAVYLTYLEDARIAWLSAARVRQLMSPKFSTILAHIDIDYRAPAKLAEVLTIEIRLSRMGNSSFDFAYRIVRGDALIVVANSTQVCFDFEHNRVSRVPADWRALIEGYEAAAPPSPESSTCAPQTRIGKSVIS